MKEIKYSSTYVTTYTQEFHGKEFTLVDFTDSVHVLPINVQGQLLLIKEYRAHEESSRWKLVAGFIDKEGKSPLEHAQEELAEEAGMQSSDWSLVHSAVHNDTFKFTEHFFVCKNPIDLDEPVSNPDEGCVVEEMRWVGYGDVLEMINAGEVHWNTQALAALLVLEQYGEKS